MIKGHRHGRWIDKLDLVSYSLKLVSHSLILGMRL